MTLLVVDAGVEDWEEDGLDILTDDDLARDVDVDLGIGGPRYPTGPGGKFPSCQGQGGRAEADWSRWLGGWFVLTFLRDLRCGLGSRGLSVASSSATGTWWKFWSGEMEGDVGHGLLVCRVS